MRKSWTTPTCLSPVWSPRWRRTSSCISETLPPTVRQEMLSRALYQAFRSACIAVPRMSMRLRTTSPPVRISTNLAVSFSATCAAKPAPFAASTHPSHQQPVTRMERRPAHPRHRPAIHSSCHSGYHCHRIAPQCSPCPPWPARRYGSSSWTAHAPIRSIGRSSVASSSLRSIPCPHTFTFLCS